MGAKLGQWIRDSRVGNGLTQSDLAGKLKVSQPQISQWERGAQDPGADVLEKLRRLFGEPPAESSQRSRSPAPAKASSAREATPPSASEKKPTGPRLAANGTRNGGDLGFEAKLWAAADKLRGNIDSAEYKHVVLGLIFLKYIHDAFEERRDQLRAAVADPKGDSFVRDPSDRPAVMEDRDEYLSHGIFWVPVPARWPNIQGKAKQPTIGKLIDEAMEAVEKANPTLKGVLPKDYARPALDKHRLGELVDMIGSIPLGDRANRSRDVLGRVYEYFLSQFASAEGKKGGEFYTPRCVVRLLVEMLAPYKGRVYDPCCGSGGMFVQSERFIEEHGGRLGDISIYGQEMNHTTWRMAKMNLAIRGIETDLGPEPADTFHRDLHPDLRADYLLANPPFNMSDWGGDRVRDDVRWKYGVPPTGNANYAWIQHFIHHLAPRGMAGFVMANGSMSSNQSGEGEIRRAMVEADLVDCMIAMPGQLFYSTQIPVCLWFLTRSKTEARFRERRGEVLFIDARKLGTMVDRTHRELTDEDMARVAGTYHAWRGDKGAGAYVDVAGFCMAAKVAEIEKHGFVLTPGRYVGAEEAEVDGEPFEEKMRRLAGTLREQQAEAARLDAAIVANLRTLGFWEAGR
jgi:type I restriction enzyme M protein